MPRSAGDFMRAGSFLRENELSPAVFGKTAASRARIRAASPAMIRKVALHPSQIPMVLPSGSPTIMAMEEPLTTKPRAVDFFPSGARLTARGVTIDQKIACAQATPILEIISMWKSLEKPDRMWLAVNRAVIDSMSFLLSFLAKTSLSGSEARATTQAYMVMSMPAFDSEILKSAAMSDRSPIGMNSEVLKIKAENVSPVTGSQARRPVPSGLS